MESERRSERVKAGMERARAEGKQIGRPKAVEDDQRDRIQQMVEEENLSYREVKERTGFSKSTISRIINGD
jgi:DNA invertase Pin-like site-specific DNA recombinase